MNEHLPAEQKHAIAGLDILEKLEAPVGVGPCPLTETADGVVEMARGGADIVVYKTVASVEKPAFESPHWQYVNAPVQLDDESDLRWQAVSRMLDDQEPSMANSVGLPSAAPEVWQQDVRDALGRIGSRTLLILSVAPTLGEQTGRDLSSECALLAKLARETGVRAVELDASCGNVPGHTGNLYTDVGPLAHVLEEMRYELGRGIALGLKVGLYESPQSIRQMMYFTGSSVDWWTTMNTVPQRVIGEDGSAVFPGRERAGLSGAVIRTKALSQLGEFVRCRQDFNLTDKKIFALGGATRPEHLQMFLDLGADAALAVTGVMAHPNLLHDFKHSYTKE